MKRKRVRKNYRRRRLNEDQQLINEIISEVHDFGHFVLEPFDGRRGNAVEMIYSVDYLLGEGYDGAYMMLQSDFGIGEAEFDRVFDAIEREQPEFLLIFAEDMLDIQFDLADRQLAESIIKDRAERAGYVESRRSGRKRKRLREQDRMGQVDDFNRKVDKVISVGNMSLYIDKVERDAPNLFRMIADFVREDISRATKITFVPSESYLTVEVKEEGFMMANFDMHWDSLFGEPVQELVDLYNKYA